MITIWWSTVITNGNMNCNFRIQNSNVDDPKSMLMEELWNRVALKTLVNDDGNDDEDKIWLEFLQS